MKGSYSVYVIFPKTIKPPEHLETNLAPSPPRKISITLTRNSSLWEYMLHQCVIPWKKPQAPEKMSTYFFLTTSPSPTPRKYFNRHCKISITRTN